MARGNSVGQWAIGVYRGSDPFQLVSDPHNPQLSAIQIDDQHAEFVADPFMLYHNNTWYLFFETLIRIDAERTKGVIGLATSSDTQHWQYQGTVLEEPWHLSYPHVFEWQGGFYLLPETLGAACVRLYRAQSFPHRWQACADLLPGAHADATPFYAHGRWWMFSCTRPQQHDRLELFYADDLLGPWQAHPLNPLIEQDARRARPAGRVIEWQGRLLRFAQDCEPRYGSRVRVFEILQLSPTAYVEQEHPSSPILAPSGQGWNGRNMHHIDLHALAPGQWLACVDGYAGA